MSTLLIRSATSQTSSYPIISRINLFKIILWKACLQNKSRNIKYQINAGSKWDERTWKDQAKLLWTYFFSRLRFWTRQKISQIVILFVWSVLKTFLPEKSIELSKVWSNGPWVSRITFYLENSKVDVLWVSIKQNHILLQ